MAPEILQGLNPSTKSDLYQLGLIFDNILQNKNKYKQLLNGLMNKDAN